MAPWQLRLIALSAVALACSDGTGPGSGPPGLTIVAGGSGADTVDAVRTQALVVSVRDTTGAAVSHTPVRFTGLAVQHPSGWIVPSALVGALSGSYFSAFGVDTTDESGQAAVLVQFGPVATSASIEVVVPVLGLVETARYTVRPGAVDSIAIVPADSAIHVGRGYTITARAIDRHANGTGAVVQLAVADTAVARVSGGTVTGRAYGRVAVVGSALGVRDTAWTSVVPTGVLAVTEYSNTAGSIVATIDLDGSGHRQIPVARTYSGAGLAWARDTSFLVGGFDNPKTLYRFTTSGASTRVLASTVVVGDITAVDVSANGQWVYFSAGNCNYNEIVYKVAVTDSIPQRVSAATGDDCFNLVHAEVSLAPDGARAAVAHYATGYATPDVQVLDLTSGVATPLGLSGDDPRWAPFGNTVAFVGNGRVWVVQADGTGARAVSPPSALFGPGLAWSPDGAWLLAHYQPVSWNVNTYPVLLRVATGEMIPLPASLARFGNAVWQPAP